MSRIQKMSIQGIRAFDSKTQMAIEINTPLTLIVGTNGSGKTTIIECLKYMTTGGFPPNSGSGRSFVHDPAMTGEKEIMGQVKLLFLNTEGTRMVCTRNMSITVKQKARTFKQLETVINMNKNGEKAVISSRMAEINGLMPRLLGASAAILENVIFCHQEDSLWPLAAPKDLKEKFDAIFEADKYTKAVDNIKVLQKNKKMELVQLKADHGVAKSNNDKAKKLKKTIADLMQKAEDLEKQRSDFERQGKEAQRKAEDFWQKVGEAELIVGRLQGKRIARDTKQESVDSLRENLSEMFDTDEELQNMLSQYEARIQVYETDLVNSKKAYRDVTEELQDARNQANLKERELGKYEAQKLSYEGEIENRKKLIRETARSHEIRGFESDIGDQQAKEFMDRITKKAREQQNEFERHRSHLQDNLQRQQKVLTGINEQKSAQKQSKETSRDNITNNDRKIASLQSQQNGLDMDEGGKATIEYQLSTTKKQFEEAKAEMGNASFNATIDSADRDLRSLEERKDKLDSELIDATQRAGDTAQLDFVQKERNERQRSLDTMMKAHGERLKTIVGDDWTPASLESSFQRAIEQSTSRLAEAERQRNGVAQQREYQTSKINELAKEMKAAESELADAEKAIRKAVPGLEPKRYHERVEELERDRDALKTDADQLGKVVEYLQACMQFTEKHNTCKTCRRPFKKDEQVKVMQDYVQKELQRYEANNESVVELGRVEEDLEEAKKASSSFEAWERLKEKIIPEKRRISGQLETERNALDHDLEKHDLAVQDKKDAKREVDSHGRTVQSIVKYYTEIASFENQIRELSAKQTSSGSSRGLEAIRADRKKADEETKSATSRKADAVNTRDRLRSRISSLELHLSDLKGKLSTAEWKLKEQQSLRLQEEEYKALNADERSRIKSADDRIHALDDELSTEQTKYDDISRRGADEDRELQNLAAKLNGSVEKLRLAERTILAYHENGGDQLLERCQQEIKAAKSEMEEKESQQSGIVRDIKQLEEDTRNHDETKRGIVDNLHFRRDLTQLKELEKEIEELETHGAEADKLRYQRRAAEWQQRRSEMAAQEASVSGQGKSIDDQLEQALKDQESEYANAAEEYKKAHILVETTKAAIEDLGRYGGALDKAIMKYHSMKMEEINRIIEDLWRKTYQGTDVDTIMIRSENEEVKQNKSYNYRVCMMKQDTELDMRGRCSAGQKVLASIIIRLALAECFGTRCGLIALDEPTTNLDHDNIIALAESLNEIIRIRRVQSNFQLIVITHDEEFLKAMNAAEYTDSYYRVYRSANQCTAIDKQNIHDL